MATAAPRTPSPFPTSSADATNSMPATSSGSTKGSSTAAGEAGESSPAGSTDKDLLARVVEGAHAGIDRLAESAAPHVHKLQESMSAASDSLHQRSAQARETGAAWGESLRCTVRERPLTAVATALAIGVLAARLSR